MSTIWNNDTLATVDHLHPAPGGAPVTGTVGVLSWDCAICQFESVPEEELASIFRSAVASCATKECFTETPTSMSEPDFCPPQFTLLYCTSGTCFSDTARVNHGGINRLYALTRSSQRQILDILHLVHQFRASVGDACRRDTPPHNTWESLVAKPLSDGPAAPASAPPPRIVVRTQESPTVSRDASLTRVGQPPERLEYFLFLAFHDAEVSVGLMRAETGSVACRMSKVLQDSPFTKDVYQAHMIQHPKSYSIVHAHSLRFASLR